MMNDPLTSELLIRADETSQASRDALLEELRALVNVKTSERAELAAAYSVTARIVTVAEALVMLEQRR